MDTPAAAALRPLRPRGERRRNRPATGSRAPSGGGGCTTQRHNAGNNNRSRNYSVIMKINKKRGVKEVSTNPGGQEVLIHARQPVRPAEDPAPVPPIVTNADLGSSIRRAVGSSPVWSARYAMRTGGPMTGVSSICPMSACFSHRA